MSADVKARSFKIKSPLADPLIKKNVLYVYIQNKALRNIIFKNEKSQLSPSIETLLSSLSDRVALGFVLADCLRFLLW